MENFEDYEQEKRTIDINAANGIAVVILFVVVVMAGIPFYFIWEPQFSFSIQHILLFLLILFAGIIVHELIHGFFFGLFARNGFKSIRFGVLWKMLTPYCHCKEPIRIKHYFIGALMPALMLGLIPLLVSLVGGSAFWLIFGIIFTSASAGDFMVVWILRKEHPETYVQDHPSEAGCYLFRKK